MLTFDKLRTSTGQLMLDRFVDLATNPQLTTVSAAQDGQFITLVGTFIGAGDRVFLGQLDDSGSIPTELPVTADAVGSITAGPIDAAFLYLTRLNFLYVQSAAGARTNLYVVPIAPKTGEQAWPITKNFLGHPYYRLAVDPESGPDLDPLTDEIRTRGGTVVVPPRGNVTTASFADGQEYSIFDGVSQGTWGPIQWADLVGGFNPPNVSTMTLVAAQTAAMNLGMVPFVITTAPHLTIPKGNIIAQFPPPTVLVPAGAILELWVSEGPVFGLVPDFFGQLLVDGIAALAAIQVIGVPVSYVKTNSPLLTITNQTVRPGEPVPIGTVVGFEVSSNAAIADLDVVEGDDTCVATVKGAIGATLAKTEGPDTLAAVVKETVGATFSKVESPDTLVAVGVEPISASLAKTEGGDTLLSGAAGGAITASLAKTESNDTLSAAVSEPVAAAAAIVEDDDTLFSSSGGTTTANAAIAEGADTVSASLTHAAHATLAVTEAADTVSAAATEPVTAVLAKAEAADTLSAAGAEPIVAALAVTEASDTLSSAGNPGSITADAAITEADDTLIASSPSTLIGDAHITEQSDGLYRTVLAGDTDIFAGDIDLTADGHYPAKMQSFAGAVASIVEGNDTLSATGSQGSLSAALAVTEADDTLSSTVIEAVGAALVVTEDSDTCQSDASIATVIALAITEANDTLSSTVIVPASFALARNEGADTLSATVVETVGAALSIAEASDTLASTATEAGINAALAVVEQPDTLLSDSGQIRTATLIQTEQPDTLNSNTVAATIASLSVVEAPDSLAALIILPAGFALNVVEGNDLFVGDTIAQGGFFFFQIEDPDQLVADANAPIGMSFVVTEGNDFLHEIGPLVDFDVTIEALPALTLEVEAFLS